LICGRLCFEVARGNLVLAALPEIIVMSARDDDIGGARLRMLMPAIHEELQCVNAGAGAIATDLRARRSSWWCGSSLAAMAAVAACRERWRTRRSAAR